MGTHRGNIDPQTRSDLHELGVEFSWKLDHAEPAGFSDLFEREGRLIAAEGAVIGTEALDEFAARQGLQLTVTRTALAA